MTTLYYGTQLFDAQQALQPIDLETLYEKIRSDAALREETERLRRIRRMDEQAYRRLKARLPYFCCGQFSGGLRKNANFISIETFVLDIDKVGDTEENSPAKLKAQIIDADKRVLLLFTSPGGQGLKVLFPLDKPCTDTKQYSDFYKAFAMEFAGKFGLEQQIDLRTSDVSRVCFCASDPEVFLHSQADSVDWEAYLPESASLYFPETTSANAQNKAIRSVPLQTALQANESHNIAPDVYAEILRKLKVTAPATTRQRPVFVPEALNLVFPAILAALQQNGILIEEVRDIQFGKQLHLCVGADRAVLNIYFGKKGFSVVNVPKSGVNESLSQLAIFIVEQLIFNQRTWVLPGPNDKAQP